MKGKKMVFFSVAVALLISGGLTIMAFGESKLESLGVPYYQPKILQVEPMTTNVLLQQILAELIKANSLKEVKNCSDGEK